MNKYSKENLISVNSFVEEYFRIGDNLNKEYLINEISLDVLKEIIPNVENDDELYLSYSLTESMVEKINNNLKQPIIFDFEKFEYFLQRYGRYK